MHTKYVVAAVIVTHNRRQLLRSSLYAIALQASSLYRIIIVDNASTDGTHEMLAAEGWLSRPNVELITLPQNIGGAGGFNYGIRRAYELGADWAWVMDDDCIPQPDCLERLLTAIESFPKEIRDNIGFLASRVLWKDGAPCLMNLPVPHQLWIESHAITSNLTRISSSSFVSMLINRKAIEAVGLPVKEFFIWFDDSEYCRRISEQMPCYLVSDSVVVHQVGKNVSALDFAHLDDSSLWKFSFGIRNEASYLFEKEGLVAGLLFCLKMLVRARKHLPSWHHRIAVAKACWNGFRFRYTHLIERV